MLITRILYLVTWVAALWQLWQGLTTGCFSLSHYSFVHCFAQNPLAYIFDFVVVIALILGLPFLVLSGSHPSQKEG